MTDAKTLQNEIVKRLNSSQKNVLCLHRRPDGDSLGSNLALAGVLKKLGKDVTIYSSDPVPEYLTFLPGANDVEILKADQIPWAGFDTFWALDMSSVDMLGSVTEFPPSLDIVVIDHHKTNTNWGKVNLVEPTEVSCASVLYKLFTKNTISIDKTIAQALLTGLLTDTGFFSYIDNGAPLKMAAELMETHKLNYQEIDFNIHKQMNIDDIVFIGNALSLMQVNYEKKVALLPIPYKNYINFGDAGEQNYLLTGYLQSINGTNLGILIIEEKPGKFRIQFRSRLREFDVSAVAFKLGGGGHKNAAGATIENSTMEQVIHSLLELLP